MRFLYQIQLSDLTLQKYKYYFIRPNKHSAYKRYSNNKTQYKKIRRLKDLRRLMV